MGAAGRKAKRVRKLRRSTPEERRKAVEAFSKSGLTQAMFAKQWGVNPITFSGWVARAAEGGTPGLEPRANGPGRRRGAGRLAEPVQREVVAVGRRFPTFGLRKIRDFLRRFSGLKVSAGSVRRVLRAEGVSAPQPVARRRRRRKAVGPPMRFERARPNELWQTDITYVDVPWSRKPLYLVAFLDDNSRYVVSAGLHPHQRADIVLEALAEGISKYGKPQEVLSDQGRQYFAWRGKCDFQKRLKLDGIQHVVARAHHPQTVGKCERLWKTLQEELWDRVILRDLEDARARLAHFVAHYNFERPHQGIDGAVPADRFFGVESEVRRAIEATIARNALRLALGEAPRRPVYLVGQIDGQQVSVHGEAGRVVVQLPSGEQKEIATKDLGVNPSKEAKDERDQGEGGRDGRDGDDDGGEGAHARAGEPGSRGPKPQADGVEAPEVSGAAQDAVAGTDALAGGLGGGASGGAQDGDGDPVDVAGQEHA